MATIDRLKEEIGWFKVIFAILVATDISPIAWLAEHFGKATLSLLVLCSSAIIVIALGIGVVNKLAYRKIEKLEDI